MVPEYMRSALKKKLVRQRLGSWVEAKIRIRPAFILVPPYLLQKLPLKAQSLYGYNLMMILSNRYLLDQ
jgi:hypothetical protein